MIRKLVIWFLVLVCAIAFVALGTALGVVLGLGQWSIAVGVVIVLFAAGVVWLVVDAMQSALGKP